MKSNTSPDMIAAFFANGGKVHRIKGRAKPRKSDTLRSGNHRVLSAASRRYLEDAVSHIPAMPPRPEKPKVIVPTSEHLNTMTNVALVDFYNETV